MRHAATFVRQYADAGDMEISTSAVDVIIKINELYVNTKGRTFFAGQVLMDNGMSTDSVINMTLEQLRMLAAHGLQTNNEGLIENAMRGMAVLAQIYACIEYGQYDRTKTHANFAACYLDDVAKKTLGQPMPDVTMSAVRMLRNVARHLIAKKAMVNASTTVKHIGKLGLSGALSESHRPVTDEAMRALAALTAEIINSRAHDPAFTLNQIASSAKTITLAFLRLPDTQPLNSPTQYLSSYHSTIAHGSLASSLTDLANKVVGARSGDADAEAVAKNFEQWSGELWSEQREMFQAAATARSILLLEISQTIEQLTHVLLAVANSDATPERLKGCLIENANRLIGTLGWVPDERDVVHYADGCRLTDTLISFALRVARDEGDDVRDNSIQLLVGWAFRAASHQSPWGSPERALAGVAAAVTLRDLDSLPCEVEAVILRGKPILERLPNDRMAAILDRLNTEYTDLRPNDFAIDLLEVAIVQLNRDRFRRNVEAIVALLPSPERPNSRSL